MLRRIRLITLLHETLDMMKFVCFKNPENGSEEIIIFPKTINHDCFAEVQGHIKNQTHGKWHRVRRVPVSAGFVTFTKNGATCFGKSETLGLETREQDTDILLQQLGM